MKRKNHLYESLLDFQNILEVYDKQIRVNTKNKRKVEQFEHYKILRLRQIENMLKSRQYCFHPYHIFLIQEPKYRIIMSQNLSDKVINHLVAKYLLLDVFEPTFIDSNVATRVNKGTLYGVRLVKRYINQMKTSKRTIYYLKCDIKKYFYSIDHIKLMEILKRKIKDSDALNLLECVLHTTNDSRISFTIEKLKQREIERVKNIPISEHEKRLKIAEIQKIPNFSTPGKGIPIGNMTSQAFAIIYLNELDHYIKEVLHIKYYIRYMDDFVLFHHDKEYLKECLLKIKRKLEEEYLLELNPKTKIGMINQKNGLDFLGYRYYLGENGCLYLKLRNTMKRKFKRKLKKMYCLYYNEKISGYDFLQVVNSYKGHFSYANTYYFMKHYFLNHSFLDPFCCGVEVRIQEDGELYIAS